MGDGLGIPIGKMINQRGIKVALILETSTNMRCNKQSTLRPLQGFLASKIRSRIFSGPIYTIRRD
jgi:hypothetical protein